MANSIDAFCPNCFHELCDRCSVCPMCGHGTELDGGMSNASATIAIPTLPRNDETSVDCPDRPVTAVEVASIIDERLNERSAVQIWGNISYKQLGEMVGQALLSRSVILIDGTGIKKIANHKPEWRK